MNQFKTISMSADELRVANYIVLFGGRDLTGEYFTPETELKSAYVESGVLHVDFEHGLDPDGVGMSENDVLGYVDWKTARTDATGVFVERVLNRRARYMDKIEVLLMQGLLGSSSEAVHGEAERTATGEIKRWPLKRDSLTFTPAEPRMIASNALAAAKSLYSAYPNSKSLAVVEGIDSIKSALDGLKDLKSIEALLRDAKGFSRSEACALVAKIRAIVQSDSDQERKTAAVIAELNQKLKF